MSAYDFVLFDLDGTVVESQAMFPLAMVETLRRAGMNHGFDPLPSLWRNHNGSLLEQFTEAITDYNAFCGTAGGTPLAKTAPDMVQLLRSVIGRHRGLLKALPGAFELLELCRHNGKPVWGATNGQTDIAGANLRHVGMSLLLPGLAAVDQVARPKPFPDMLFHGMDTLGMDRGKRALMIGDSEKDLDAAKAADALMRDNGGGIDCAIVGPAKKSFSAANWLAQGAKTAQPTLAGLMEWLVRDCGWADPAVDPQSGVRVKFYPALNRPDAPAIK